jgi:hypothetical protein
MAQKDGRERRQISLNPDNFYEKEILNFIDRREVNFSGLVKELLFKYLNEIGHFDQVAKHLGVQLPPPPIPKHTITLTPIKDSTKK